MPIIDFEPEVAATGTIDFEPDGPGRIDFEPDTDLSPAASLRNPSLNPGPLFAPSALALPPAGAPKIGPPTAENFPVPPTHEEPGPDAYRTPYDPIARVIGPPLHGGIELSKRVAEDLADNAAAILRGESAPGLRNIRAFANDPTGESPSDVESRELLGPKMRALEASGKMGATLPVFMGEVAMGGGSPAALAAITGTTAKGEVDPVNLVAGLTIGKVHGEAANFIKSTFFKDVVAKLSPEELRAASIRVRNAASGQGAASDLDQKIVAKLDELATRDNSVGKMIKQGATYTSPWAQTPSQALIEKVATQMGGIGAANGYFLALQMPHILEAEDPQEALLTAVAQLGAASVPGLLGLAGPTRARAETFDINGGGGGGPKANSGGPKRLGPPPGEPAARPVDFEPEASAPQPAGVLDLIQQNVVKPKVEIVEDATGKPIQATPNLAAELQSAITGNQLKPSEATPNIPAPLPTGAVATAPETPSAGAVAPPVTPLTEEDLRLDVARAKKAETFPSVMARFQQAPPPGVGLEQIVADAATKPPKYEVNGETVRIGFATVQALRAELVAQPENAPAILNRWAVENEKWQRAAAGAYERLMQGQVQPGDDWIMQRSQYLREPLQEVGANAEKFGLSPTIGRAAWKLAEESIALTEQLHAEAKARLAKPPSSPTPSETPAPVPASVIEPPTVEQPGMPVPVAGAAAVPAAAPAKAGSKSPWWIRPRSDGIVDVLDSIQEAGGLARPDFSDPLQKYAGEYDGMKAALVGPARLLRRRKGGLTVDKMILELQADHQRIKTPDDLWQAIREAVAQREHLRTTGGGHEAQTDRFWQAIGRDPKSKSGLVRINASDLRPGDKFRLRGPGHSHEVLTVTSRSDGLINVQDGPSFGSQELPESTEFWAQKSGLELHEPVVKAVGNARKPGQGSAVSSNDGGASGFVPRAARDSGEAGARERLERAVRSEPGVPDEAGQYIQLVEPGLSHARGLVAGNLLAKLFGSRVSFFTNSSDAKINGWTSPDGRTVFIAADNNMPHQLVVAEELLHQLRINAPGIYNQLARELRALQAGDRGDRALGKLGYTGNLEEEQIAHFAADQLFDPDFLRRFAAKNPGLFKQVIGRILNYLDRLLARIKAKFKGYGSADWYTDLEQAREHLAEALARYGSKITERRAAERAANEPFSRRGYVRENQIEQPQIVDGPAVRLKGGTILPAGDYPTHQQFLEARRIHPDDVESGGWIKNGLYDSSGARSDTLRWKERKQAQLRVEGRQELFSRREPSMPMTEENQAAAEKYRTDFLRWKMGSLPAQQSLQLGRTPEALRAAGLPDGDIYIRQDVLRDKPAADKHAYPVAKLMRLPEALNDPILVHESWTQPNAYVALLDLQHHGENMVAALHFRTTGQGLEVTEVASVYPRKMQSILEAINRTGTRGGVTYYNQETTREWLAGNSGSNSPQYLGPLLGQKDIPTNHDLGQGLFSRRQPPEDSGDLFGAPESVADQKAREAREKSRAESREARAGLSERASARLIGKDLDTTKEMFGADVQVDKEGQSSLFSRRAVKTQQDEIEQAQADLRAAIAQVVNRPDGMTKARAQEIKNLAAAKLRNLRHDLLTDPAYVEAMVTQEREVSRQLRDLLKLAGVKLSPDAVAGREDHIRAALSEPQIKRLLDLDREWERLRDEIEKLPKKLVGQTVAKLYPKPPPGSATNFDIPSEWLAARLGDRSPVTEPGDIITARDKIAVAVKALPDELRHGWQEAMALTRKLKVGMTTLGNRDVISYTKDAADNQAQLLSHQAAKSVLRQMNRLFGVPTDTRNTLRERALTFAIEARNLEALRDMRATVETSQFQGTKWAKNAVHALNYAEQHFDRLEPIIELYRHITDAQVAAENGSGIKTLSRSSGYVFHLQDVLEHWQHLDYSGAAGGAASPFKQIRDYATYADSIAAGLNPKSLNAIDLLQRRISLGQKLINYRGWVENLKTLIDPTTKLPLAADVVNRVRADGEITETAPIGFQLMRFAGQTYAIHKAYTGLFKALTTDSDFRQSAGWNTLMHAATTAKHTMLLFDTFHLGRMAYWSAITRGAGDSLLGSLLPGNPFSYKEGLTLLESTPADLAKMVEEGELTAAQGAKLQADKLILSKLVRNGLNVGSIGDNIYADWIQKLPVAGTFNRWLFEKFQRGAMTEGALIEFARQQQMHPELTADQVARLTAKAINIRFGNLNAQSLLSRFAGDLMRLVFLAPQWNESLLRSEYEAVKDAGKMIKSATIGDKVADRAEPPIIDMQGTGTATDPLTRRQRRLVVGTLGRAVVTAFIGQFIANQILNLITRGHPTWENPEEGEEAKISAYIPDVIGNGPGFFLNPMTLPAEMTHLIMKGYHRTGRLDLALLEAFKSRFSSFGRFADVLIEGKNGEGGRATGMGSRLGLAVGDAAPLPIGAQAPSRMVASALTGENKERYPGQFQRQVLSTFGVKLSSAPSAVQRITALAHHYNQEHGVEDQERMHSPYASLDNYIKVGNHSAARAALADLLETRTREQIADRYKQRSKGRFTGAVAREQDFKRSLTPEQRQQYEQALRDRAAIEAEVKKLLAAAPRALAH